MEKKSVNDFDERRFLTFIHKMNEVVLQDGPVLNKIQEICTHIDDEFNTYSTFTYIK